MCLGSEHADAWPDAPQEMLIALGLMPTSKDDLVYGKEFYWLHNVQGAVINNPPFSTEDIQLYINRAKPLIPTLLALGERAATRSEEQNRLVEHWHHHKYYLGFVLHVGVVSTTEESSSEAD